MRELYLRKGGHVDPSFLLQRLAALDAGEAFCDGGQHDCEELLTAMMDRLHQDLVPPALPTHQYLHPTALLLLLARCDCRAHKMSHTRRRNYDMFKSSHVCRILARQLPSWTGRRAVLVQMVAALLPERATPRSCRPSPSTARRPSRLRSKT